MNTIKGIISIEKNKQFIKKKEENLSQRKKNHIIISVLIS